MRERGCPKKQEFVGEKDSNQQMFVTSEK